MSHAIFILDSYNILPIFQFANLPMQKVLVVGLLL